MLKILTKISAIVAATIIQSGCDQPIACQWECVANQGWQGKSGGVAVYGTVSLEGRTLTLIDYDWVTTIELRTTSVVSDQRCFESLNGEDIAIAVDLIAGELHSVARAHNRSTQDRCTFEFDTLSMVNTGNN